MNNYRPHRMLVVEESQAHPQGVRGGSVRAVAPVAGSPALLCRHLKLEILYEQLQTT